MEAVISDFRDLLQVNQKERVEDVLNCDERSSVDGIESEISFRAFMCPTADPFRKSNSSSSSYGILMELLEQGNLIKEAVRRLKTSPGRNKQLKRLDRCRINHIGNSLNFSENHCFAVAESLCLHFVVMSDERFYDDRL
ncbi:unnamed protein product [Porites lobata]|uniref:Uncharacterized protein n=1 Tax=Porites lobata TaxID=104759 RepID=A0ABN8R6Y1_9CNID|nr:unnamed protein product [Porites lobata]